jgi:hypothetical protein
MLTVGRYREILLSALFLVLGISIANAESRPHWEKRTRTIHKEIKRLKRVPSRTSVARHANFKFLLDLADFLQKRDVPGDTNGMSKSDLHALKQTHADLLTAWKTHQAKRKRKRR